MMALVSLMAIIRLLIETPNRFQLSKLKLRLVGVLLGGLTIQRRSKLGSLLIRQLCFLNFLSCRMKDFWSGIHDFKALIYQSLLSLL